MLERVVMVALGAALVMSCAAESQPEPVGSSAAPIVDGVRSTRSSVVFLYNLSGAACTATIVAPRAVLTAKHCIQGSGATAASSKTTSSASKARRRSSPSRLVPSC